MCTSLYTDDAAVFVAPFKEDVPQFTSLLEGFGEVTGLVTNLEKSLVAPIRYDGLNLDDILDCFPATRAAFPLRYLGLPLSVHRLWKVDLQHLVDKAAGKLVPWQGRLITTVGRAELVKPVLSSLATFHATTLKLLEGTISDFVGIERAFLWSGSDKVSGDRCKVSLKLVCRPKRLGGLGILDIRMYVRALRLRWL